MVERILVPTDGSERASRAADWAIDLARETGGELHFLYVVDTSLTTGLPEDWAWEQIEESLREEGNAALEGLVGSAREAGLDARAEIGKGVPHSRILSYAQKNDVDLIAISTAGRRGLEKLLMGSTTDRVLRSAECPVVVIKGEKVE